MSNFLYRCLIFSIGFSLHILFYLIATSPVIAEENFRTDINVEYRVQPNGKTAVTNTISIVNLKSEYFPKKYVLNLNGLNPQNVKAYESGNLIKTYLESQQGSHKLTIDFSNLSVGKGTEKTFVVSFEDRTLTLKTGEIWEVTLPKVNDPQNYNTYKTTLLVPSEIGEEAYISPEPTTVNKTENTTIYKYENYHKLQSGITAGFGNFQVFSFSINYHLDYQSKESNEIALPPDTSTQRVFYETIIPPPIDISLDSDGNWIAKYNLKPKQQLDIKAQGYVQVFAKPTHINPIAHLTNSHDTLPTTYWQADDINIKSIADSLGGIRDIYDYVVESLNYNYKRTQDNYVRFGAVKALENRDDALCMEFTDLFIALARAKGIPAREINGYAYSQNSRLEPISLVTDVIHSWPEYWDEKKLTWVPVDPTWGKTTGGVDFFEKLDLRHFAFVIHSKNPVTPYSAGIYKNTKDPKKDISVRFDKLPYRKPTNVNVEVVNKFTIPFLISKLGITLTNNGPTAIYSFPITSQNNGVTRKDIIVSFLPFSKQTFYYNLNYGFLGYNAKDHIILTAGDSVYNIPTNKETALLGQLGFFMLFLFTVIFGVYYSTHKQKFSSWRQKLLIAFNSHVKKLHSTKDF